MKWLGLQMAAERESSLRPMRTSSANALIGIAALTLSGCHGANPNPGTATSAAVTPSSASPAAPASPVVRSAYSDPARETETCQLLDDPAGPDAGYSPAQYAFMLLRAEPVGNSMVAPTTAADAARIMVSATRNYCPTHAGDLPRAWAEAPEVSAPQPSTMTDALTLARAVEHLEYGIRQSDNPDVYGSVPKSFAEAIDQTISYLNANNRPAAVDFLQSLGRHIDSERTMATLVDSIGKGIVDIPAKVQAVMDVTTPS